ncbi:SAM-dependent methyltransferase [Luteimonas sp. TWI662]
MEGRGRLACVGVGMMLGAHLGPRARRHIETAEVVFVAVSDPLVELWVRSMNADVRSLQPFYREGRSRHRSYAGMIAAMLAEVRAGRDVCGAFYGHPGVFAQVPHQAIAAARAEGFQAVMEPGISAEDCLYADLGIDPGDVGCQHYEASQFLFYRRIVDPAAWLVLWQVGVAGVRDTGRFHSTGAERAALVARLARDYPPGHVVTLYEAATLPTVRPRLERLPFEALAQARLHQHTTLVVPPGKALERDVGMAWSAGAAGAAD